MTVRLPRCQSLAGVEKLCKDLKVDPTDRLVLLLAWKVGSQLPAKVTESQKSWQCAGGVSHCCSDRCSAVAVQNQGLLLWSRHAQGQGSPASWRICTCAPCPAPSIQFPAGRAAVFSAPRLCLASLSPVALQMGAQKMGYFSRAEFSTGLSELGATSVAQLRKVLPSLASEVRHAHALEQFHRFAFRFCLTVRWRCELYVCVGGGACTGCREARSPRANAKRSL